MKVVGGDRRTPAEDTKVRFDPDRSFAVGDLVVYASHGIGRVVSKEPHRGNGELLVLVFERDLTVTLPLDRAQNALRSLSGEPELEEVQRTLGCEAAPVPEHWSRRHRNAQAKLTGGSVSGLAEIVRDGVHRERERSKSGTAPMTNQLYRQARKLLVAEVAAARGIEPDAADAWIGRQIDSESGTPPQLQRAAGAESEGKR